ncbi:MAG: hypothetical protein M1833_002978 [Piccolia ochrophora]|nr:MAG: hypothetical protein M1833_002978 [Piccolia ochrophora]
MTSSPFTSSTFSGDGSEIPHASAPPHDVDLSSLPPVMVLPTHLEVSKLHEYEDRLLQCQVPLTYDAGEARIFLGKVGTKRRAEFELRSRGLWTKELANAQRRIPQQAEAERKRDFEEPARKRRRTEQSAETGTRQDGGGRSDTSSTESETGDPSSSKGRPSEAMPTARGELSADHELSLPPDRFRDSIGVAKLDWLLQSLEAGRLLPIDPHIVYEGQRIPRPEHAVTPTRSGNDSTQQGSSAGPSHKSPPMKRGEFKSILERAKEDSPGSKQPAENGGHQPARQLHGQGRGNPRFQHSRQEQSTNPARPPPLIRQSTSEFEEERTSRLPEMPDWVKQGKKYACERSTPANPPNAAFIEQLKKIKLARLLTGDEIGVRAYSTSIAALAAYPHTLSTSREILALPGCDTKIAHLFHEWKANDGHIQVVADLEADQTQQTLRLFYDIWGVGAHTARSFYHDKGWRDLDDIVEYGWSTLSRVQQIGVKYHAEFQSPIPRPEVESIAAEILRHARAVRDDGIECAIVGGYRRGKTHSGDVDLILSHRSDARTLHLVRDVVVSLETAGWITHTLLLTLTGTRRDQNPLPFRTGGGGHGFDTLDKALVVWQDVNLPPGTPGAAKNPNIHRRVDIIIAPWRTVGCAVAGWSGGTTFQRDLRRYAKHVHGWKFDSSGVRDRASGEVVDLEGVGGESATWEEAERKVFEGLGLVFREPWERCTG